MVVSFSHKGHLLAIGSAAPGGGSAGSSSVPFAPVGGTSPYAAISYSVRLFDPDTGVEVWSDLFAHFGVIYDIKWSLSDTYFLTCSSDGTCKVWKFASAADDELVQATPSGPNISPRRASTEAKRRRRSSMGGVGIQATVAIAAFQVISYTYVSYF
jgi:WD40 repeat protein